MATNTRCSRPTYRAALAKVQGVLVTLASEVVFNWAGGTAYLLDLAKIYAET